MIRGVIFDMDGLMFDTERLSTRAWLHTGEVLGLEISLELINSMKGTAASYSSVLFKDRFGQTFDYDNARAIRTSYMDHFIDTSGVPVKQGLLDLLKYLNEHSIPAAVATSTRKETAMKYLKAADVYGYFKAIIYGDSVPNGKPAPDIFLKAAEMIDVPVVECLVLEDSTAGILAGEASGAIVIHIPDEVQVEQTVRNKAYCICDDLSQVIERIEILQKLP